MRVIRNVFAAALALLATGAAQQPPAMGGFSAAAAERERAVEALLAGRLSRDSTGAYFRELTRAPHPAGSDRNKELADWVAAKYRAFGLDDVRIHRYDVYLPWPREVTVEMTAPERRRLSLKEDVVAVDPDTKQDPGLTYLGMSGAGDVTGELVYASSGNPADYDWLEQHGVSLEGKIALVRYSVPYSYRGYKALVAQQRGLKAVLIYSDPQQDGASKGAVFPDGPWGPLSHIQRGSITYDFIVPGDPLTPGWASVPGARRIPIAEARSAPTVMMVPMSARDAQPLLATLGGPEVPKEMRGALPLTYRGGPGPTTVRVKVDVDSATRPIWVVEGRIRGSEEPDKLVVLGNHRDAWVFGAVDPSSGTATQLELARVLGGLAREGRRPKRTLVFASWDAEEWHLTGSTEWGEQFADELRRNGVAYLNVDGSVSGPDFEAGNVASLNRLVTEVARDVTDPASGGSVLDAWMRGRQKARESVIGGGGASSTPVTGPIDLPDNELGSGSDYTVFLNFLGLPIVGMDFDGPYGVYHSIYDDYYWMTHFGDPGFRYMTAMADVWGRMALRLANADVLPMDFAFYAKRVGEFIDALAKKPGMPEHVDLGTLRAAQRAWLDAGTAFNVRVEGALAGGARDTAQVRALNAAARALEQQLLLPDGIPGRPWFRHALYAPKPTYDAMTLPGITEAVDAGDWDRANAQVRALAARLTAAAAMLGRVAR
ncbi:MAG: M28 family metallopeptidase [Gemmatimonadota bacterium]|nr:M28 family metallopeptidase [Gemmatimonadota bacterium]